MAALKATESSYKSLESELKVNHFFSSPSQESPPIANEETSGETSRPRSQKTTCFNWND